MRRVCIECLTVESDDSAASKESEARYRHQQAISELTRVADAFERLLRVVRYQYSSPYYGRNKKLGYFSMRSPGGLLGPEGGYPKYGKTSRQAPAPARIRYPEALQDFNQVMPGLIREDSGSRPPSYAPWSSAEVGLWFARSALSRGLRSTSILRVHSRRLLSLEGKHALRWESPAWLFHQENWPGAAYVLPDGKVLEVTATKSWSDRRMTRYEIYNSEVDTTWLSDFDLASMATLLGLRGELT